MSKLAIEVLQFNNAGMVFKSVSYRKQLLNAELRYRALVLVSPNYYLSKWLIAIAFRCAVEVIGKLMDNLSSQLLGRRKLHEDKPLLGFLGRLDKFTKTIESG